MLNIVGLRGIEPRLSEPKSDALPLHQRPIVCSYKIIYKNTFRNLLKIVAGARVELARTFFCPKDFKSFVSTYSTIRPIVCSYKIIYKNAFENLLKLWPGRESNSHGHFLCPKDFFPPCLLFHHPAKNCKHIFQTTAHLRHTVDLRCIYTCMVTDFWKLLLTLFRCLQ